MTDTEQLEALEAVAGVIDPGGKLYSRVYLNPRRRVAEWVALDIRLGQCRRWLEAWCDERKGRGFDCSLANYATTEPWHVRVKEPGKPALVGYGPSLAHAYAKAITALEAE